MNNAQIRQYWRTHELARQRVVKKYAPGIYRAIYRQLTEFDKQAREDLDMAMTMLPAIITPEPIKEALRPIYTVAGASYGRVRYRELMKILRKDIIDWRAVLALFFEEIAGFKITSITETTRQWITRTIEAALQAGQSYEDIADRITDRGITLRRARMIARTESQGALNYASRQAAIKTEIPVKKMWISALDKRTRRKPKDKADHWVMHKQIVEMNEPFSNGLMQPGDPDITDKPEEIINCRCTVAFIPIE